jgi:hypothetical protein
LIAILFSKMSFDLFCTFPFIPEGNLDIEERNAAE